ncbi:glycosyltransferase family 25 protein [Pseudohoeflea coraliihabitans]|uniref:Glycosyltransferase family 25 protein n=1 Tax=Pseudohoeflea coraliihabitans TaxID=2860393 RepID=A0ABS6WQW4_9HYPH|nr:glycosyltransferase family 25 protein [Pseudohoeflea sp. DP4N28-3]MBW3098361.1 glycosyltransferase family 25 protein [Pseudohoeflea sp. DP4N28-3]
MTWRIFVLSLDDAKARRNAIASQLGLLNLDFEIVSAIDGRNGLPEQYEALVDRDMTRVNLGRDMAGAEYACAISHHQLYKRIENEGLPGAIILEDDAILSPLFAEFLTQGAYAMADLIVLDHWFCRIWRFSQKRLTENICAGRLSLVPCLTTGYSISASGARYLIKHSLPISRPADWPCDITKLNARATIPRIVDHPPHTPETSSTENHRRAVVLQGLNTVGDITERKKEGRFRRWLIKRASKKLS